MDSNFNAFLITDYSKNQLTYLNFKGGNSQIEYRSLNLTRTVELKLENWSYISPDSVGKPLHIGELSIAFAQFSYDDD